MSPPPIPKVKEDRSDSQPPPASLSMVTSRAFTPPRVPPGYAVTSVLTYVRVPVMAPIDTPPDTVVPDLENHETIFPLVPFVFVPGPVNDYPLSHSSIRNACYYTQYSHIRQTAPQYQPREPFNSRAHELNARYPLSNDVDYEASCDATGSLIRGELDRYGGLRALPPQSDVFVNAIETWLEHGGAPPHGTKRARRPSASSEKTDREGEEHVPKRLRPQMSAERFDTRSMGSGANRSGSAAGSQAANGHVARHVGPVPTPPWGETRYQRQHSSTPDTVHTESMDVDVAHPRVLSHPATSDRGSSIATVNGARRLSTPHSSHGDLMARVLDDVDLRELSPLSDLTPPNSPTPSASSGLDHDGLPSMAGPSYAGPIPRNRRPPPSVSAPPAARRRQGRVVGGGSARRQSVAQSVSSKNIAINYKKNFPIKHDECGRRLVKVEHPETIPGIRMGNVQPDMFMAEGSARFACLMPGCNAELERHDMTVQKHIRGHISGKHGKKPKTVTCPFKRVDGVTCGHVIGVTQFPRHVSAVHVRSVYYGCPICKKSILARKDAAIRHMAACGKPKVQQPQRARKPRTSRKIKREFTPESWEDEEPVAGPSSHKEEEDDFQEDPEYEEEERD